MSGIFPAIYLLLWFSVQESPRWLISEGRDGEALAVLQLMASENGAKPLPTDLAELDSERAGLTAADDEESIELEEAKQSETAAPGLIALFCIPLRTRMMVLLCVWF